jgi:integrase
MPLTVKRVAKLRDAGRYLDGNGLYLQVLSPSNRSWLLRYERGGRERWMGLGPLHAFDLDEARERARQARQQLADGIDPLDARKTERAKQAVAVAKSITFEQAALQYFNFHERKWANVKYSAQFLSSLRAYAFPVLGKLPVAEIDVGFVLKCLEPIWQRIPETANRVRGRVEAVLDWATVRGYRHGENPARWKNHLSEVLPARRQIAKVQHHRALRFAAMPDFMAELAKRDGIGALALQFLIFSATRSNEVLGARWLEIDLAARLWVIPAARMKGGREHRVPLSDSALAILAKAPRERENEFVFIGAGKQNGLSPMAMREVLIRMGRRDTSVHGFRSTFRDWAAETTAYPNHICEMALAHVVSNKAESAYRRGDLLTKRAHLMSDWARFCTTPQRGASVTSIRVRR